MASGAVTAMASSGQPEKTSDHKGCVRFHIIERMTRWHGNMDVPPDKAPPGYMAIYFSDLFDATSNKQVGRSAGTNDLMDKKPDGTIMQYVSEQLHFSDGSVIGSGPMSRNDVIAQKWVSTPIKGTSGKYQGMVGRWTWRIMSLTDPAVPVDEKIVLCQPDHRSATA
jgi:hypothetical protein